MKKLIPLFTFTFGLHLSLLALSISSEEIDAFMHLPDWFPTSVDDEHTFGSDEHTNCTHRTTLDTLAAVESVFDAYHERVFFASEGRSNDWSQAVYGPRPTNLQRLWFTNAENSASCFVYSTWTNAWPRATPDSRRLVEFDNAFELSRWLPDLFGRRKHAPWLDKGFTWGLDRDIMFGSSWGPTNNTLPSVGWTENGSFRPDLAASCVPLCYCATDSVFNVSSPSSDGFLYDLLKGLDSNFNALYRIEGGPWPEYSVRTNGWLAEWHNSGKWTNSVAAKTSVPGIITNSYPLAGPEAGMTNLTRRLVPDDYVIVDVTNIEHVVNTEYFNVHIDYIYERPRLYMTGPEPEARESDFVDAWMTWESTYNEYDQKIFRIHYNLEYVDPYTEAKKSPAFLDPEKEHNDFYYPEPEAPDGGCDKVAVKIDGVPDFFYSFEGPYYIDDETYYYEGYPVSYGGGFEYSGTIDFIKIEVVTTAVRQVSSILATESRALAMLDRTYEIPACVVPTNIPESSLSRDTFRRCESTLNASGTVELDVKIEYPSFRLDQPVRLMDIITDVNPHYSTSNMYSEISSPTVVKRRLSGLLDQVDGGFVAIPEVLPHEAYRVRDLKRLIADVFGFDPWFYDKDIRISSIVAYEGSGQIGLVSIYADYVGEIDDGRFSVDLLSLIPSEPVSVNVVADVLIYREASVFLGGVPDRQTFDRMYPWYGPGPFGYSNDAVGESRVLFAEEALLFEANKSEPVQIEWSEHPISLPAWRTQEEIEHELYTWNSWHKLAASNASSGTSDGLAYRVYTETYDSLQNKVDSEFRAKAGNPDSASTLIPVSLSMAHIYEESMLTGFEVGFSGSSDKNLYFVIRGPDESDVIVRRDNGRRLPDDTEIVTWTLTIRGVSTEDITFDTAYSKSNVAVDGRLSPVIVTDWNWKALKSERNEQ